MRRSDGAGGNYKKCSEVKLTEVNPREEVRGMYEYMQ
jgi:hypothetical protein